MSLQTRRFTSDGRSFVETFGIIDTDEELAKAWRALPDGMSSYYGIPHDPGGALIFHHPLTIGHWVSWYAEETPNEKEIA